MKVWISPQKGNHYGFAMIGGVLSIVFLALLLTGIGILAIFAFQLPKEISSLLLCLGITGMLVALALKLGQKSLGDTQVFVLDDQDRLYLADLSLIPRGRNWYNFFSSAMEVERMRQRLAKQNFLPPDAARIVQVERIKENDHDYAVGCWVRYPSGGMGRRTIVLVKGYPDEDLLLLELERRQGGENRWEQPADRSLAGMLLSLLALVIFIVVCVLSHPAIGKLPQAIYFPCLGTSLIPFVSMVYWIIRRHRGE